MEKEYTLKCTKCGYIYKVMREPKEVEKKLNSYCPICDEANIDIMEIK